MIRFNPRTQSSGPILLLTLLLIATFSAAGGLIQQKDFEGEIEYKMFTNGLFEDARYAIKVKGTRSRIETEFSSSPSDKQTSVMLVDYSANTSTRLYPETKTYVTVAGSGKSEGANNELWNLLPIGAYKVTSTGKTETIAGLACQHWLLSNDNENTDWCLAKGLGHLGGYGASISDGLKKLAQNGTLNANPEFLKFVEGGALPLKISAIQEDETTKEDESFTFMEATSIERKSLDDSLFTIPPDYKKADKAPEAPGTKQ
jgi:Domain of unknown function (DUF4412)